MSPEAHVRTVRERQKRFEKSRFAEPPRSGLKIERHFSKSGLHPFEEISWEKRDALITNHKGEVIFEQKDVEVPSGWSQLASNVVVSKYFHGHVGTGERETSIRQLIGRVAGTISRWGREGSYFASPEDAEVFSQELHHLLVNQMMAFNSPVWFNVGVEERPQCSACFINSVEDSMSSILDLAKTEGMLFKYGSGAGTNLSPIRSSKERLAGGGTASGPVSFMKGFDAFAGVIKSGGKTRRAAKMVILNADHPDVMEFIRSKAAEEKKAWTLIDAGYNGSLDGEAYGSVYFQNANHSVRVTDDFMQTWLDDGVWSTRAVRTGEPMESYRAKEVMRAMAEAAWLCGDPGIQYDTTINDWHTCAGTDRIHASNPCSEYMFLNDTACFAPETRISTPFGLRTVLELYEMQERGEQVLVTTDLRGEEDHRRVTAHRKAYVTEVGRRPVFRLRLSDGREIRVTEDHRFLTDDGSWKEVRELGVGTDRIAIRESGNPVVFESSDEEVARWRMLGWMTGDGVFSRGTAALVFGPDERETASVMEEEFQELVASASASTGWGGGSRRSHLSTAANGVMQISSKSTAVVELLEDEYGMRQGTAIHKDAPDAIHRVADDLKVAWLQGLFSADGCIRRSQDATEPEVMLASSAPRLLSTVQLLLADFGITSRITWTHPDGRKNPQGQLHIYNEQGRTFLALIGMPCSATKAALASEVVGTPFRGASKRPRPVTVLAVEPDGEYTVYDITEPVTHSVIAEGLIAHNCNLASLNLMKFRTVEGDFDINGFLHAVRITLLAQEILVDNASYPTRPIELNSYDFRPLGLGYANLGALLMSRGLAYDSEEGRNYAAAVTSLMHAAAYRTSAEMAGSHGPFAGYPENEESMLRVIGKHRDAANRIEDPGVSSGMQTAHQELWDQVADAGKEHGFRNSQVTVLAPTGTIAFMMDCDTTGIEPDIALVKYKKLVGGGMLKIVNRTVPLALEVLGYSKEEAKEIVEYIDENDTIEGAPWLKDDHLPIFDCAFKPAGGVRSIHWMGHIRMMGAVQPFLSGAISKTVNMPNEATVEEIERAYVEGWRLGLKALAIYRDGCKRTQPLNTSSAGEGEETAPAPVPNAPPAPRRVRLPDERRSITHKFSVGGHEGYITVGMYENGQPGELFVTMAKEGSTISGLMDTVATMSSMLLQYGVPLSVLVHKFSHTRFEPSGFTNNREVPIAKSIIDYIFRWLAIKFMPAEELGAVVAEDIVRAREAASEAREKTEEKALTSAAPETPPAEDDAGTEEDPGSERSRFVPQSREASETQLIQAQADAPACPDCGSIMVRNGACYKCLNCGATSGCS